ncbi:MAG TPA: MmcQ/YjbR family DNA-binding protein [Acidobacteriaceae bacterium]|jgi:predicted DNA-binding protein (MmcQ/YjbR family)|nr:MmcQ/YjbR family DNA-binding protein [Acidobacteriaceae bacterium]
MKNAHVRIQKLSALCLALPGALRIDQGDHASFRVGGKVFAYLLNNHHDDGIVSVACKALPGDNQRLIDAHPRKFYLPAYVGPRGWVGLRLDLPTIAWSEVQELVRGSYLLIAPMKKPRAHHAARTNPRPAGTA